MLYNYNAFIYTIYHFHYAHEQQKKTEHLDANAWWNKRERIKSKSILLTFGSTRAVCNRG